ncbi:MAG: oxygen-independent coproporphyrinogen III oxidase [Acidobacteriia bacterium]|nr:oxygen-independent coproporphyrinogen III oxidase [Terriglobia bacterium]
MSSQLEIQFRNQHVVFPEALLDKYNIPGPRYTSYPTAPEWKSEFGPPDMESTLDASNRSPSARPLSLYMHLPFCDSLCLFCGCNVVIQKNHEHAHPYLERLKWEIDAFSKHLDRGRQVIQFHWGGGTPTYLSPEQLEDLFVFTRERFSFSPQAEIGVEVDPRVTTEQHVRTLRRLGFNRISMGVQDFNPVVQKTVHRVQPYELTANLVDLCREAHFESINIDLIYGLPHQTGDSFADTVDKVIGINPDRIAMFSYAHVPWLKKQQGAFAKDIPDGADKFQIFRSGVERFTAAGYDYIGFDHFARPNDELCVAQRERTLQRNFQGYTTKAGADLLGLGVSSISGIDRVYAQNFRDLESYGAAIDEKRLATMRGMRLSDDDVIRRAVINRILCHCVLHKSEIEAEFHLEFDEYFAEELPRLEELARDGLLELRDNTVAVTLLGRVFIRIVGMAFDKYLRQKKDSARPLFSKTL